MRVNNISNWEYSESLNTMLFFAQRLDELLFHHSTDSYRYPVLSIIGLCDECKGIGAELPVYELTGTTLWIRFKALESALIDQPKAPKHQNTDKHGALDDAMVLRIIEKIKEQPDISQEALGESIGVTRRVVQKYINVLKESGRIERVGGKRYGHWKIND